MSLNMRGDQGCYCPARDIVNLYPSTIQHVINRFNNVAWPELAKVVEDAGCTWDDLCDAMEAMVEFLSSPVDDPHLTMLDALNKTKWFELPTMAHIAIFAMFGTVGIGQLYYALRDTTPLGAQPQPMAVVVEQLRAVFSGVN